MILTLLIYIAGQDAGGLRREYIEKMKNQIVNNFKLFIPSPNSEFNVGSQRDKVVPNPSKTSTFDLRSYYQIGFLMGLLFKTRDIMMINLPSFFWDYILGKDIEWPQMQAVDQNQYNSMNQIEKLSKEEIDILDQPFTVTLVDKTVSELIPNGRNKILR